METHTDLVGESSDAPEKRRIRRAAKQFKYGKIDIEPGTTFTSRKECAARGVHAVPFAGIHGSKDTGAYSVCLSGGYEDDVDNGEFFIYTGTGGQRNSFSGERQQDGKQNFEHPSNKSLQVSLDLKQPVRVVRGKNLNSKWAPAEHNYRYDGLYLVEEAYLEEGISGHTMCKFKFRRQAGQPPLPVNEYFGI